MSEGFVLELSKTHWLKLADFHKADVSEDFKKKMNKKAIKLLKTYKELDFVATWPEKDVALACCIFRSLIKSKRMSPSDRALREICENASDYESVLKPMKADITKFLLEDTKYHKIRGEMEIWGKLTKKQRKARRTYSQFVADVTKGATNIDDFKKFCTTVTDDNSRYMYNIALDVLVNVDKQLKKKYPDTNEVERLEWINKNMKFMISLWKTDFKKFAKK